MDGTSNIRDRGRGDDWSLLLKLLQLLQLWWLLLRYYYSGHSRRKLRESVNLLSAVILIANQLAAFQYLIPDTR